MSASIWSGATFRLLSAIFIHGLVEGQLCSKGWRLHGETYYRGDTTKRNYGEAQEYCRELGGRLAILKTEDENNFVRDLSCDPPFDLYRYWIGMTDLYHENDFKWNDFTDVSLSGFERWAPGEPNDIWGQDCVVIITSPDSSRHGRWSTEVCDRSKLFSLCQKPLVLPKLLQSPEVSEVGSSDLKVTWTGWNEWMDQGDGPVVGYYINVKNLDQANSNWTRVGFVSAGQSCEFVVHDLEPTTAYQISVSLLHGDSMKEGPLSPSAEAETHDIDLPVFLRPPALEEQGPSHVVVKLLNWKKEVDKGEGPVKGYYHYIKDGGNINGGSWRRCGSVVDGGPLAYMITNLLPNVSYEIMVTVVHIDGKEGPAGPALNVSTTAIESHTGTMGPITSPTTNDSPAKVSPPSVVPSWDFCIAVITPSSGYPRRSILVLGFTVAIILLCLFLSSVVLTRCRSKKTPVNSDASPPPSTGEHKRVGRRTPPPSYRDACKGLTQYNELQDLY